MSMNSSLIAPTVFPWQGLRAGVLASAVLALGACATTTTAERMQTESEQVAAQIEETVGFVDNPELAAYIENVGKRVSEQSAKQDVAYRFQVLDMDVPNAMALPSGHIYISRGLLVLGNSEDEIAGVLAHEVAHVEQEHARGRSNVSVATSPIRIGTGIAGWATGIIAPSVGEAISGIGDAATGLVLAPYSRDQEREADSVGQTLAAASGYDPGAISGILDAMGRQEALDPDGAREQSFFDTHPSTDERVALTRENAASLSTAPGQPVAKDQGEVLRLLEGLVIGPNPAKGFFSDSWFVHPALRFAMVFPADWQMVNTGSFVAAKAKEHSDFLMLFLVAKGDDPQLGARVASEKLGVDLTTNVRKGTINELPAAKNRVQVGKGKEAMVLDMTWIAHGGLVFQVMGLTAVDRYDATAETLSLSAHSFRALAPDELTTVPVVQLKVVKAEQGETLGQLAKRTDSVWSSKELAVVNDMSENDSLEAGTLVKIAVRTTYKPAS
jgi:predicted Zn-dependent protease